MLVRDVMTNLVLAFRPTEPIEEVARRLLATRISGAPVAVGDTSWASSPRMRS